MKAFKAEYEADLSEQGHATNKYITRNLAGLQIIKNKQRYGVSLWKVNVLVNMKDSLGGMNETESEEKKY